MQRELKALTREFEELINHQEEYGIFNYAINENEVKQKDPEYYKLVCEYNRVYEDILVKQIKYLEKKLESK
jgi:hypothetical protein